MKKFTIEGRKVGCIGLGCMGMSWAYGPADKSESLQTLNRALDIGVDFWDTADVYGAGENEILLSEVLKSRRDDVFLCTKFGNVYDRAMTSHQDMVAEGKPWIVDGTPEYVKKCCDASLQRLGVETIDLYYQHRVDPRVPIEETMGALVELKNDGKIRFIGLSEASEATIRRAEKIDHVSAVQSELSLWTRDFLGDVVPTTKELEITFVAYSPLGRGFLTGKIEKIEDLHEDDWRRVTPRMESDNFATNFQLTEMIKDVAKKMDCTPAQVALAWVMGCGEHVLPIPGTKQTKYLEENAAAEQIVLSAADRASLGGFKTAGERYAPMGMEYVNG